MLCVAYGYFLEPRVLLIRHEEIAIKSWDPAFEDYRIVMIGDVHGGSNGASADHLKRVVERANAENADAIVLLGDFVSQSRSGGLKMPANEIADNLAGLKARDGVFAVLGNHDFWFSDDVVRRELSRVGFRVLQNEVVEISRGDKRLRILGLKDQFHVGDWKNFSDEVRRVVSPTDGENMIALAHSPDMLPIVSGDLSVSNDLKLILAAHTHGGQVWLPIFGRPVVPSMYGQRYAYGHVVDRGVDMWVTSGVGTSVLPVRFMVPPEIVVMTIRSAQH